MDLKTISGILVTRSLTKGTVVIDLSRNQIVSGDLDPGELRDERIIAPGGMTHSYFNSLPCITIGMREFTIQTIDRDDFASRPPRAEIDSLRINSSFVNRGTRLKISWDAPAGSKVEEITYLAIGPVSAQPGGPD